MKMKIFMMPSILHNNPCTITTKVIKVPYIRSPFSSNMLMVFKAIKLKWFQL